MTILPTNPGIPLFFDQFSLHIQKKKRTTGILMKLNTQIVNTRELPETYKLLQQNLPSILRSQCFNDMQLPFDSEVRKTEIGHLFEHILLEYLCILKLKQGVCKKATYSGKTDWNWVREARGTFHIHISSGLKDLDIFPLALEKTIKLMQRILDTQNLPVLHSRLTFATIDE